MTKEAILYTDPNSGDILDTWKNPYTGEDVRVVEVTNDPYNWVIAATVQQPACAAETSPRLSRRRQRVKTSVTRY